MPIRLIDKANRVNPLPGNRIQPTCLPSDPSASVVVSAFYNRLIQTRLQCTHPPLRIGTKSTPSLICETIDCSRRVSTDLADCAAFLLQLRQQPGSDATLLRLVRLLERTGLTHGDTNNVNVGDAILSDLPLFFDSPLSCSDTSAHCILCRHAIPR